VLAFASFGSEAVAKGYHFMRQSAPIDDFVGVHTSHWDFSCANEAVVLPFEVVDLA